MPKPNRKLPVADELRDMTPAHQSSASAPTDLPMLPGKVVHDLRGAAVYEWDVETAVFAAMDTADALGILDNPALALEIEPGLTPEWSGDPYNRR